MTEPRFYLDDLASAYGKTPDEFLGHLPEETRALYRRMSNPSDPNPFPRMRLFW